MEQLGFGIASGVVGGLITALILFVAAILWRDKFIPWIENRVYDGIRVDGTWCLIDSTDGEGEPNFSQHETLEIEQKAARLSGRVVLIPKSGSDGKPRTLKIDGCIRDRFVMFTCVPGTRRGLGYQAFLGEISGDGGQLIGQASYFDTGKAKVAAIDASYQRKDE
jgi:hypothetical protein